MLERLRLWSHRWPRTLADALLPACCALCGQECGAAVCAGCHGQYVARARARCPCCANPLAFSDDENRGQTTISNQFPGNRGQTTIPEQFPRNCGLTPNSGQFPGNCGLTPNSGVCGRCLAERPAFDATVAACDYAAPLDGLVLQLKFGARLALAPWFAQMLRDAVLAQPGLLLPDILCPVPLGPGRLAERGFNQSLEIARPLAAALGVALEPRLALRVVDTRAQSGVAPAERADNIRNAFSVAPEHTGRVEGRHVGIVDDVMTSGHTLNELALEFKRAGAARVTNFVFARTPPN